MSRVVLSLLVIGLSLASTSAAAQVYKCKRGTGYSYQDSPCPGRMVKRIEVPTVPPAVPRAAPAAAAPAASGVPAAPPMVAAPAPAPASSLAPVATGGTAAVPPPPKAEAWQCTRHDGSRYFSVGKLPRGQQVPAALAPASATPGDGGNVFVPDQCTPATREALCAWYAEQATANQQVQASARGMDLRRAQREGQRLKALRSHRCGGG